MRLFRRMDVRRRGVAAGLAAAVCGAVLLSGTAQAASTVPFSEFFSDGDGTPLNNLRGWSATGDGTATVIGQRARLQDITLSHAFTPVEHAVKITFELAPMYTATGPSFPPDSRFRFYVNTNGLVTAYDGGTATNLTHTPIGEGSNVTFQVEVDYPLQTWSLAVGGVSVATDLALSGGDADSRFEELGFIEGGTNLYAYLDSVSIQRAQTASTFVLPFTEPFNALTNGPLSGQRDWSATDALVQGSVARGGKACSITSGSGTIEHTFTGGHTNVWTDLYIRPLRGAPPAPPAGATFAYYVKTNGVVVAYDGLTPTELPGTFVPAGTWVRFSTYSDYANTNWDLYLNSRLVGEDLGFYSTNVTNFTAFGVAGGDSSTPSYVDDIYVGVTRAAFPGSVLVLR